MISGFKDQEELNKLGNFQIENSSFKDLIKTKTIIRDGILSIYFEFLGFTCSVPNVEFFFSVWQYNGNTSILYRGIRENYFPYFSGWKDEYAEIYGKIFSNFLELKNIALKIAEKFFAMWKDENSEDEKEEIIPVKKERIVWKKKINHIIEHIGSGNKYIIKSVTGKEEKLPNMIILKSVRTGYETLETKYCVKKHYKFTGEKK